MILILNLILTLTQTSPIPNLNPNPNPHPIPNRTDWRNAAVKKRIAEKEFTNIEIIPFADITKAAADMHVCSPHTAKQDCKDF